MLLRYRRYRVFLVFAVILVLAFYSFSGSARWEDAKTFGGLAKSHAGSGASSSKEDKPPAFDIPDPESPPKQRVSPPAVPKASKPVQKPPPEPTYDVAKEDEEEKEEGDEDDEKEDEKKADQTRPTKKPVKQKPVIDNIPIDDGIQEVQGGQGRVDIDDVARLREKIYWEEQDEHFPVSKTIQLPSGTPKPIPRVQHKFKKAESKAEKKDRTYKLSVIHEAFTHAWNGYKEYAWGHDELTPVSGESKDPFCGWGATLIDTLDALWILGLKEDFENATEAIKDIEFTTSPRDDIPVFETVIRYLGGLLGAYDVSGGQYKVLLDKAVELADVLMGCFDTPNRMPVTYYHWKPDFASQPKRAGTHVVLAELGSLSLEFTRLAQLTKEPRYYDAIARITDELEKFQKNSRVPGMWPTNVDSSGCQKPDIQFAHSSSNAPDSVRENADADQDKGKKGKHKGSGKTKRDASPGSPASPESPESLESPETPLVEEPECIPMGLASSNDYMPESFTIGGLADSTYEYLTKEYVLLGGLVEQYQPMYEIAADAIIDNLVYKPMLPGDNDIRMTGILNVPGITPGMDSDNLAAKGFLDPEGAHLTCFAGAMVGLGAKIFDRPGDLALAGKMTDFCIWAYNATTTGIMPESFRTIPCQDPDRCEWSEELYHRVLDPNDKSRQEAYKKQLKSYHEKLKKEGINVKLPKHADAQRENEEDEPASRMHKRQLDIQKSGGGDSKAANDDDEQEEDVVEIPEKGIYIPVKPLNHEEFVEMRIKEERLPTGIISLDSRKYILRPEAIESIFYMWRMTGEQKWRDAGWHMFKQIQQYTRTEIGHTAIDDVTKQAPDLDDTMESFWLAETLKYLYLLFEDPQIISLDEWVLNTEAHPFRRPDADG